MAESTSGDVLPGDAVTEVIVVTLRDGWPADALLEVRATTNRVVVPPDACRYVLDEVPSDAGLVAARLVAEPWCLSAEVFQAVVTAGAMEVSGTIGTVSVHDPAAGLLHYHLFLPGTAPSVAW